MEAKDHQLLFRIRRSCLFTRGESRGRRSFLYLPLRITRSTTRFADGNRGENVMPFAPLKPCPAQGCRNLIHRSARWCERHTMERMAEYEATRPSPKERGYTGVWRQIRARILDRDPVCKACGLSDSTDVDHIVPRREGGTEDDSNLQGLCHPCHSRKTAIEDGRWARRNR